MSMLGSSCSQCCEQCGRSYERSDPADEGTWIPSGSWKTGVTWAWQPSDGSGSGNTWYFYGSAATTTTADNTGSATRRWSNLCNWWSFNPRQDPTTFTAGGGAFPAANAKRATRLPDENSVVFILTPVDTSQVTGGGVTVKTAYFYSTLFAGSLATTQSVLDSTGGAIFSTTAVQQGNNSGTINGGATFTRVPGVVEKAINSGTVNGGAAFFVGDNNGTVNGGASLHTTSTNSGTVNGGGTFNDSARNALTVSGGATFNGGSSNTGTVGGGGTFNGMAVNGLVGVVNNAGTFTNASRNEGTVNGGATFSGTAKNSWVVNGGATFDGSATNEVGGTVNGGATFNGDSCSSRVSFINGQNVFAAHPTDAATCNTTKPTFANRVTQTCGCG